MLVLLWQPLCHNVLSPQPLPRRSVAPTAFAGYSFHVAEAALVFANEILVCFLFPIHAGVHRAYHLATTAIHIGAVLLPGWDQGWVSGFVEHRAFLRK